VRREPILSSKD